MNSKCHEPLRSAKKIDLTHEVLGNGGTNLSWISLKACSTWVLGRRCSTKNQKMPLSDLFRLIMHLNRKRGMSVQSG